jgi:FMN-dependent NADH-azoreductase
MRIVPMKIMHVDTSPKGDWSNSRTLSRRFIDALRARVPDVEVDYLDLDQETPPHVTKDFAIATYAQPEDRTAEMRQTLAYSDALCERLLAADACVFAMPMYNWSMPSRFKAYIDAITRPGITYKKAADGQIVGQLSRQKVLFVTSRGADLRPGTPYAWMDALTPALRAAFAFIGATEPSFVDAQPMTFADQEARAEGLARAHAELDGVVEAWVADRLALAA